MYDEAISQAEIDALVRGLDGTSHPPVMNSTEWMAALQRYLQAFGVQAGSSLSDLLGTQCQGGLSDLSAMTLESASRLVSGQVLLGRASLVGQVQTDIFYLVPLPLGLALITQIYGGVAPSQLDSAAITALTDGLTQFHHMGVMKLAEAAGKSLQTGPVQFLSDVHAVTSLPGLQPESRVVAATLDLSSGETNGRLFMLIPEEAAAKLATPAQQRPAASASPTAPSLGATQAPAPPPEVAAQTAAAAQAAYAPAGYPSATFPDLPPRTGADAPRNINLLMDVSLQVTVELGRTRRQIREVLALGPGSVMELDRLAGEAVDVLINGKLIAKGEVVVIDENYGVRITDIVSPAERVQSLK